MAITYSALGFVYDLFTVINFVAVLVFCSVFLLAFEFYKRFLNKLPPGPTGYPYWGYLKHIEAAQLPLHIKFDELSKDYGPIFSVSLGLKTVVVITDPELISSVFNRKEFTDRPSTDLYKLVNKHGIVNISGDEWKKERKFASEKFRSLGMHPNMGKQEHMEAIIMNEVKNLIGKFTQLEGEATDIGGFFKNIATNIICTMIMSERFEMDDPVFLRLNELYYEGFILFVAGDAGSFLPHKKWLANFKHLMAKLKANQKESREILLKIVNKRRAVFDHEDVHDILDYYLQQEHMINDDLDEGEDAYDATNQILQILNDLFSGGQETVASVLMWSLVHLVRNPDILENVKQEIDTYVSRDRLPNLSDMNNLNYTRATINEILRISAILPFGTLHAAAEDTRINDYFIPKGTIIFPNLVTCMKSPLYFRDPEKFDPTRFLTPEGKYQGGGKNFIPFGAGRRKCLGEILARSELNLILSSLIHTFDIEKSTNSDEYPQLEGGTIGVTITPRPFKVCLKPRNSLNSSTKVESSSTKQEISRVSAAA